jgi:large subunit ribosomal protein L4
MKMDLPSKIFGEKENEHAVHAALVWYLSSRRRGTHSAKTRSEVRGGGTKPWRQKGTGRARVGSIRSPLWRKGGVIFPPKPRNYAFHLPKKARKLAIRVVLSDKARAGKIKVVDELKVAEPKTRLAVKLLKDLKQEGRILVVLAKEDQVFAKAARNIAGVKVSLPKDLNIFDLLSAEWLLMEKAAVGALEEVLS